jgi:hypothetical protein
MGSFIQKIMIWMEVRMSALIAEPSHSISWHDLTINPTMRNIVPGAWVKVQMVNRGVGTGGRLGGHWKLGFVVTLVSLPGLVLLV